MLNGQARQKVVLGAVLLLAVSLAWADVPKRIISLYPHTTEMIAALDASRLIAVDRASNFPPQILHLPRIPAYPEPSVEALLALRPDLVVTWSRQQQARLAARLSRYGIQVMAIEPEGPEAVAVEIRKLGVLLGLVKEAERLAADYELRLARLKKRYSSGQRPRIFLQVSEKPLMTVSSRSFLGKVVSDCGADNVFAIQAAAVPLVSQEAVLLYQPEIIVSTSGHESLGGWRKYAWLPAVRNGQLYVISNDELMRPGPRLPDGMEKLCRLIDQARR